MNALSVQPSVAVTRPHRLAPAGEPRAERSDADWERGVNLFILAAATFFRSAAKSPGRRGNPRGSKNGSPRKTPSAARKRRAGPAAKRSSGKQ